jgi:chorismate synthase
MSFGIGSEFRMTVFGESHGRCIGVVVEGCPPGLEIGVDDIQWELDRRKPAGRPQAREKREIWSE